jgi:hypothetical protein
MLHERDAVGHALGDDQPLRVGEQTVLVVKVAVVDARGDVLAGVFVVDRELLVFSLFPWLVRRPRCLASDHENDAAAAPVGKHDAPVEERIKSVLVGGTERAGCGQIPRGETAFLAGQLPDDSLVAVVVRIADEEPVDCLRGQAVLGPKPFEDLVVVLEPPVIVFRQGCQHIVDPQFDQALGLRFRQFLGRESVLGQRRQPGLGREEIAGTLMALRHGAGPAPRHPARLDELHELEHVAADAAAETIPTLLVEHDMKGPVRLAAVVRAVALEQAVGFMQDVSAEQLPRDRTDVDLGDPPVILPHVVLTFECHARSAPRMSIRYRPVVAGTRDSSRRPASSRRERNVRRSSCFRFLAQFEMPQRSPTRTVVCLARVTPV